MSYNLEEFIGRFKAYCKLYVDKNITADEAMIKIMESYLQYAELKSEE